MYTMENFRAERKQYKDIRDMPQKEVSQKTGVSPSDISTAFNHGRCFSKDKLISILKAGFPLEPFILGLKNWEEIIEHKQEKCIISVEDEKIDEILTEIEVDSNKEEKEEFAFTLHKEAYKIFVGYRIKIKKPVTPRSRKKDKKILCEFDHITQAKMVQQSMAKKWQGLFPLSEDNYDTKQKSRAVSPEDTQSLEEIDGFFTN